MDGERKNKKHDVEIYPSKIEGKVEVEGRAGICDNCGNNSEDLKPRNDQWVCEYCRTRSGRTGVGSHRKNRLSEWSKMG